MPKLGLYLDAGQFTQEVTPRLGPYVDAGQFMQELIRVAFANVPARHKLGLEDPTGQKCPNGHGSCAVELGQKKPLGHCLHTWFERGVHGISSTQPWVHAFVQLTH